MNMANENRAYHVRRCAALVDQAREADAYTLAPGEALGGTSVEWAEVSRVRWVRALASLLRAVAL